MTFSLIYELNLWGNIDSVSGNGSTLEETKIIRTEISRIIDEINARTLLDCPCGDFNWMKYTELDKCKYIGVDLIEKLIAENLKKYGSENRTFQKRDILKNVLPRAELILCRDFLVHLSFNDIFRAINNLKKSKSKYILTTTYQNVSKNKNIVTGAWRPVNLEMPPFNFPKPMRIINEQSINRRDASHVKCLALWRLEDIPDYHVNTKNLTKYLQISKIQKDADLMPRIERMASKLQYKIK